MTAEAVLENIHNFGMGYTLKRYYGLLRARVTKVDDPDKLGRIQAVIESLQSDAPNVWILPVFGAAAAGRGQFFPPEVDDVVWVSLRDGDLNFPECYMGGWYGTGELPGPMGYDASSGLPEKRGIVTRAGHALVFNDTSGKESVTIIWNSPDSGDPAVKDRTKTAKVNTKKSSIFSFDPDGGVIIKTATAGLIQIDEKNNQMVISHTPSKGQPANMIQSLKSGQLSVVHGSSGSRIDFSDASIDISGSTTKGVKVNVSGASVVLNGGSVLIGGKAIEPAVLGLKLITWLATHIHPTTAPGAPTGPPLVPPIPAALLSTSVKVQM